MIRLKSFPLGFNSASLYFLYNSAMFFGGLGGGLYSNSDSISLDIFLFFLFGVCARDFMQPNLRSPLLNFTLIHVNNDGPFTFSSG